MENRGPQLAGICGAFLALSIVAVSVRCYVRTFLTKSFGYDDWLIVATLVFYFLFCLVVIIGVHYGTGQHTSHLTAPEVSMAMKMWFFCEIFYGISSTFTKLAAGSLLLRLTTKRVHIRIIWSVMALAGLFGIAFVAQIISQCEPTEFFWSPTRDPLQGHCMDAKIILGFTYSHAIVSSLGDWAFGILPAFLVKGLNMNLRTKISVFLILSLANVGSIATLIRVKAIHQISTSSDFLFATVDLVIWSSIEVGIAIIAASMATYRPLFQTFFRIGSSANRSFGTASEVRRPTDPARFGHGEPQMVGLQDMKKEHKPARSEASTSELFGTTEMVRVV